MPYRAVHNQKLAGHRSGGWFLRFGAYGSLLLGLSATALIWFGALYFSGSERMQAEKSALHGADNLSRMLEEHIIRSLRAADQTLLYARDSYARDPHGFNMSLWSRDSQFLAGLNFQVVIIDQNGIMVASNIPGSKPGLDLSDREHFRVHRDRKLDDLFISKPIFGRVSKKWSIQLTRRITQADGSFGGVAVVSVDPEYLGEFYKSIDVGESGVITLVGHDGIVRARSSKGDSKIGESLAGSKLLQASMDTPHGSYFSKSALDGIERLYVYRSVDGYPLMVTVGLAKDDIFASFAASRRNDLSIAAFLTLWVFGVTALIWRYERAMAKARDRAEAGSRARSEFLAMMSHEIRTPMNGVVGLSEVLLESGLNPQQFSYTRKLRDSAEHLLQVINDVLDFSKLEADRVEIESIAFDLHDLVESALNVFSAAAKEKNLTLTADVSPDVPSWVVGDPARLRQVLFNLVGNALKFTQKGGVTISVAVDPQPMHAGNVRLSFAVTDTGIGIPADGISMLFREFSQLDSSIARRFGGTGLGLAICKRLVALMGGSIEVRSEVGKGSTFHFTIDCKIEAPIRDVDPSAKEMHSASVSRLGRPIQILLAEDNKTNQLVISKLLEHIGLVVDLAENGIEAVSACAKTAYDLVFMDVMMPEMDGLTATRAIRALPDPFNRAYIIALTANAQRQDREMCFDAGMNDFLAKPVTRAQLEIALRRFDPTAEFKASDSVVSACDPAEHDFDQAIFNELAGVLGPQDTELVLTTFLEDAPARIAKMQTAANNRNAVVKQEAHALKSSAGSFGFVRLAAFAKALEKDAAALDPPALDMRISEIAGAFHAAKQIAETKLAAAQQTKASTISNGVEYV